MPPISRRSFLATGSVTALIGVPTASSADSALGKPKLQADSWSLHRYDNANTANGSDIAIDKTPATTWSKAVNDPGIEDRYSGGLSPPVRKHRIIIYTTDEAVIARGSANGERMWSSFQPSSCSSSIPPGVHREYVITADENVTAWDIETGNLIWETTLPDSQVATSFKFNDNVVFFASNSSTEGQIIALDIETGAELWRTTMDNPISQEIALDDNHVIGITDGGVLKTLRITDGIQLTKVHVNYGEEFLTPILRNDLIYLAWVGTPTSEARINDLEPKGVVTVYGQNNSRKLYQISRLSIPDLAPVLDSGPILSVRSGKIFIPNIRSPIKNWEQSVDKISTAPIIVDNTVIVGTASGHVVGLNSQTGRERWRHSVLDEPISGIIGGHNAVYVTGSVGTIGGIHYEPSIDARAAVQTLLKDLVKTAGYGFNRSEAAEYLQTAFQHLTDERYGEAQEAASEGQMNLTTRIEMIKSTQQTIQNVTERARSLRENSNYNPTSILNKIQTAEEALRNENPQRARKLANEAKSKLTDTKNGVDNASAQIENLTQAIGLAEQSNVPIQNASANLSQSNQLIETGEFDAASSLASRTDSSLRERIGYINQYRDEKQQMEAAVETASNNDIKISSSRELYHQATAEYESEEYEAAAELMKEASSQSQTIISTAKRAKSLINEADQFDPIPPFVKATAVTLGSATQLDRAKLAYKRGNYESAVVSAEKALSSQIRARVITNGGILSSMGILWYTKRHNGISKAADVLSQLIGEDE